MSMANILDDKTGVRHPVGCPTPYNTPLADRIRPESLDDFLGQEEIVGEGKLLRQAIKSDTLPSMIFWGPPGSGKTTLAFIIAKQSRILSDFPL